MTSDRTPRLILASSSPRRKQILNMLGVPFEVLVAPVSEELLPNERPADAVARVALLKAEAAAMQVDAGVVVSADTMVVLDGQILGKPVGANEATAMLRALRGREHDVLTGVAVLNLNNGRSRVSTTASTVRMRAYSDAEIAAYVASGEPFDKAGAYAVQSEAFHPAAHVEGCYLNVVGLPLCVVAASLCAVGRSLPGVPAKALADVCHGCPERKVLMAGCT